jgi:homocysteine S-methyltransferase
VQAALHSCLIQYNWSSELLPRMKALVKRPVRFLHKSYVQTRQCTDQGHVVKEILHSFLQQENVLILDGGLATELEARGFDLNDSLWSARLLMDAPEAIYRLHHDYLVAGADCIISATYQATVPGLVKRGLPEVEAADLLQRAVQLAREARDAFWADRRHRHGRLRPLVAASIGPYGAYLADGSEYTGRYDLDESGLLAFHRSRWRLLADSGADLLACETIPSFAEARALARLLAETATIPAWFSFSCRDGQHISDGTRLAECVAWLGDKEEVAAVGVNCTAPRHVASLVAGIRRLTKKPMIVYPNSGEQYDASRRCWTGVCDPVEFTTAALKWRTAGASLIGGCCRTGPQHISQIRRRLKPA